MECKSIDKGIDIRSTIYPGYESGGKLIITTKFIYQQQCQISNPDVKRNLKIEIKNHFTPET